MLAPVRVTPPAARVVTYSDADAHLHLAGHNQAQVEALIDAATAHLDGWTGILGRCLVNQQWRASFCSWPGNRLIRLPFPDVSDASIVYSDEADAEQSVAAEQFALIHDECGSVLRLSDSFAKPSLYADRADPVRVTFTAGYGGSGSDVPAPLRTAILLMVSHWFQHREAVSDRDLAKLPLGVDALIAPYRRRVV